MTEQTILHKNYAWHLLQFSPQATLHPRALVQ